MNQDRYARHHLLEGWDQDRLARARVLVAGVGAVGNEVVKLLALMGVGHLLLVDFDTIELSNLTRSVLFRETDVGRSKAQVAAERAQNLNPDVQAIGVQGNLEFDVGLGVYRGMDVVIGCLDSINARLALNRACHRAGVPWINTGIEATLAEIALFAGRDAAQPEACFECGMSETMWERRNQRFSCGGLHSDLPENTVPTTAVVASLAAAYAVNEVMLLLHGRKGEEGTGNREQGTAGTQSAIGNRQSPIASSFILHPSSLSGLAFSQKLYLTVAPYGLQTVTLPRSPDCLAHECWEPVTVLEQGADELSIVELLAQAGMPEGIVELGFDLLTQMQCQNCGHTEAVFQPVETCSLALNQCPHCHTLARQPQTVSWLDGKSEWAHRSLAFLRIPEHQVLALKHDGERHYVQISGEYRGSPFSNSLAGQREAVNNQQEQQELNHERP